MAEIKISLATEDELQELSTQIEELKKVKTDKIEGKELSSNDYTDDEKEKLSGLSNYNDTEVKESIQANSQSIDELKETLDEHFVEEKSVQLLNREVFIDGKNLCYTIGVSTPTDFQDDENMYVTNIVDIDNSEDINYAFGINNINGLGEFLGYQYNSVTDKYVRSIYYTKSNFTYDSDKGYYTCLIPSNVKKIRIALFASIVSKDSLFLAKASDWNGNKDYFDYTILNNTQVDYNDLVNVPESDTNPLHYNGDIVRVFGKGVAIGDSMTEGTFNYNNGANVTVISKYSYPTIFSKITGVTLDNYGKGGYTAKQWWEQYKTTFDFSLYDFTIINFGINDVVNKVQSTTIPTLTEIINKAKETKTKVFIATVIPNSSPNSSNKTAFETFNNDIRTFVNGLDDVYLIDLDKYSDCKYMTPYDNIHLTAIGYYKLAKEYSCGISYIVDNNLEDFKDVQFINTNYNLT